MRVYVGGYGWVHVCMNMHAHDRSNELTDSKYGKYATHRIIVRCFSVVLCKHASARIDHTRYTHIIHPCVTCVTCVIWHTACPNSTTYHPVVVHPLCNLLFDFCVQLRVRPAQLHRAKHALHMSVRSDMDGRGPDMCCMHEWIVP